MDTNSLFQNYSNNQPQNTNPNWYPYENMNPQPVYNRGYANRISRSSYDIPVRVVFSPEQIAPQEIPTNGIPALFPLSDGSRIIVKSLSGNGLFEERIYVLQENIPMETRNEETDELGQIMKKLGNIQDSLNTVLDDLYGGDKLSSDRKE